MNANSYWLQAKQTFPIERLANNCQKGAGKGREDMTDFFNSSTGGVAIVVN